MKKMIYKTAKKNHEKEMYLTHVITKYYLKKSHST